MAGADINLSKAQTNAEWLSRLDELGDELADEQGGFESLGRNHAALYAPGDRTLLVSFESVAAIRGAGGAHRPLGLEVAQANGWSSLCLITMGTTWFRDTEVWNFFDTRIDADFFEAFDRVVFYGAGMCGYAAAAFSVAAPGAVVLVVAPQATLDPTVADWDGRFARARRLDFTTRYGFAPDMIEGAAEAFVVYDPSRRLDAMHAALFTRSHVTKLRARWLGKDTARDLADMGVLTPLITAACDSTLTSGTFYGLLRKRRGFALYLMRLSLRTEALERHMLTVIVAGFALRFYDTERLRQTLDRARAALMEKSAG
ncbi:hypothetical protein SAMN04488238_104327 [Roseicitreum antarcticum]|uniref:Phosphoadenosine phosphosulfate reductase n=2 Tax=Roseicitreum antarcticum TaxID=564137 RepID=A0A1H2XWX3_9RHOB|nr:hypothetical protein SAMN04488238_104327 [Roseicitreum antarcticum]